MFNFSKVLTSEQLHPKQLAVDDMTFQNKSGNVNVPFENMNA